MKYTYEKVNGNTGVFHFVIDSDEMNDARNQAYLKERARIRVPGYRNGKAPRFMMERLYGDLFFEGAAQIVMDRSFQQALDESNVEPLAQAKLSKSSAEDDGTFTFDVEFPVEPDVELGEYMNLEVNVPKKEALDEKDVDRAVEAELRKHMRVEQVTDRPVQFGDIVTMDYVGSIDGVPFEGGSANNADLEIGSGRFIPGFEDGLIGMVVDEEKDINVTFPEKYGKEELNGKEAVFHIKLHGIRKEELPRLDDELVSDISEFSTVDEYRADIQKKLQDRLDANDKANRKEAVFHQAMLNAKVNLPQVMIDNQANAVENDYRQQLYGAGMTLESFVQANGLTMEQFRQAQVYPAAANQAKKSLVQKAIIAKENPEITDEDLKDTVERMKADYGTSEDNLRKYFGDDFDSLVRQQTLLDKIIDKMVETATFHEEDMTDSLASVRDEQDSDETEDTETKSEE